MVEPLRKHLGLDRPGYRGEWHAFRQYVDHVSPQAARKLWVMFERDLLPSWSFPVGDGQANIGFGILRGGATSTRDMKELWPDLLARPQRCGTSSAPTPSSRDHTGPGPSPATCGAWW